MHHAYYIIVLTCYVIVLTYGIDIDPPPLVRQRRIERVHNVNKNQISMFGSATTGPSVV